MANSENRIASLDGLRAVSILMVLLGHSIITCQDPGIRYHLRRLVTYGTTGVDVFFVISGFLITTLLLKEREKTGTICLRRFYIRRAYRILPASYAVTISIGILLHDRVPIHDVVCSLLYVQNFNVNLVWSLGHMWSLSVEEQFYLLWPFLLNRFSRNRKKILIAAMIIAPIFRGFCAKMKFPHAQTIWFPSAMDALATGCLLALYKDKITTWLSKVDGLFVPVLIGTLAIPQFSYPHGVQPLLMLSLHNLGIAFCVEHCVRKRYWVLNSRPVVWIGVLSYSIYLCQMPFFQKHPANMFERFPVNLIAIMATAVACHYLIEMPFLKLRERVEPRKVAVKMEA